MVATPMTSVPSAFFRELSHQLAGDVRSDPLYRWLYSTDASSYQVEPLGVVIPKNVDDVITTVRMAGDHRVPIIPRGSGTSLSGQGIGPGVILDFTRHFDRILEICPEEGWVRVEAGVVLDQLNMALRPYGLMVGPDPSSSYAATLGGMAANNSTGAHSIVYGMMLDHVLEMEVVLADGKRVCLEPLTGGQIRQKIGMAAQDSSLYQGIFLVLNKYRRAIRKHYPRTWRNVAGYNLHRLLSDWETTKKLNLSALVVGSEGTLGIILSLKVRVVPRPRKTHLTLLHFDQLYQALSLVPFMLEHRPSAVELLDRYFIDLTRRNAEYRKRLGFIEGNPAAVCIVEFSGETTRELNDRSRRLVSALRNKGFRGAVVVQDTQEQIANVWQVRKAGLGLLMSKRGDAKPLAFIDDAAVPVEHLADYAREVIRICTDAGTEAAFYAHASAGCLHINPVINLKTEEGIRQFREISQSVIELAVQMGGTSTGEHGEGLARSYYNERVFGRELHQAFRDVKGLFDPGNLLNPGKIVDAPAPWEPNLLRFHPGYLTPRTISSTILDFSADGGFAGMVEMCNGQGNCRNRLGGVMCPSFKALRDEAHSTRGRANALRAAISGKLGKRGLTSPELYRIFDLCLACKACKSECPSMVDMARLKSEFLAAYYRENGTPWTVRVLARIDRMYRLGSHCPGWMNRLNRTPLFRFLLEKIAGIDRRRSLPDWARKTFRRWFFSRHKSGKDSDQPRVVFWVDTFTNYLEPQIGRDTVEVLEHLGWRVIVLPRHYCCGRPAISMGVLENARKLARRNLHALRPFIRKGIPIVGVEPGCMITFRDEYPALLPGEETRQLAQQTYLIDEFLVQHVEKRPLNPTPSEALPERRALVHTHCYQKALGRDRFTPEVLAWVPGLKVDTIDSGCCGMAGIFGYQVEHYDLSRKIGEDRLFPALRREQEALIVAPGTSCRHQIQDVTGRPVWHPISLLAKAFHEHRPQSEIDTAPCKGN